MTPEFDKRCQQLLRDSARWMESRPTLGESKARKAATLTSVILGYAAFAATYFALDSRVHAIGAAALMEVLLTSAFGFVMALLVHPFVKAISSDTILGLIKSGRMKDADQVSKW